MPEPDADLHRPEVDPRDQNPGGRSSDNVDIGPLQARIAELEDLWRRALADLDNVRKRAARDSAAQRANERARAAGAWLPVLDNLDLALEHAAAEPSAIINGVRAVRDQAQSVLAGLGYPRRDDTGDKFDPVRHEAVGTLADPNAEEGTVVQVVRPGYGDGDRQLRPAAVVVARRPSAGDAEA
jgi:molecular chaperone GrpE